ncbi:SsrA-binding protein SmpB [Salibacteraceae bacterium]|jgi:SsrA-binding protein|nr:SsrA-binding protein SmpB [Salibacteraceae bacterium]
MSASKDIYIKNRKAYYNYELLEKFVAGIQLTGPEIKSVRNGEAGISESYCFFQKEELYVKNMYIKEYSNAGYVEQEPRRVRKLLLQKRELQKLLKKLKDQALTIIPVALFINEKGWAKLEIGLARGKKLYDKRESIKDKDLQRQLSRKQKD